MLILISDASANFNLDEAQFYSNKELKNLVVKTEDGNKIDTKAVSNYLKVQQEKEDYLYEMTFFAEWLRKYIGIVEFNKPFPMQERNLITQGLTTRLSFRRAKSVENAWYSRYKNQYQKYIDSDNDTIFIPFAKRKPLTKKYIKEHYWQLQKTVPQIAEELNVPAQWVYNEIRRFGLGKIKNNIKKKGRKGWKAPESYKVCRQNQPHRKAVVQICPKSFNTVKEYRSVCSVEESGFNRENVRRAIKNAGLHKGFLWAHEGMETPVINAAKKRGNLEIKINMSKLQKPAKDELKRLYINQNLTLHEVAKIMNCHPGTIAHYAAQYGLKKRTGKISIEELKRLYLVDGLSAKEIAKKYGYFESSISTYLSKNGIKKRVHKEVRG